MTKAFLNLYRFFSAHKAALYALIISTTAIFSFFACKIHFEENILALLPQTEKSKECAVAFKSIKEKDKLFVEILSTAENGSPSELAAAMDSFVGLLKERDEKTYISNVFYSIDNDDLMNVVYYLMGALPCHIPGEAYPVLDSLMTEEGIESLIAGTSGIKLPSMGSISLIDGHLFSKDSSIALAFLTPSFDAMNSAIGNKCDDMIAECIKVFKNDNPSMEVLYHGAAAESNFNSKQIKKDLVTTVGLSLLLICLLLCICLKSKRTILHLVVPVVYGSVFSLACIYLIKGSMSFIAMGIAALVLGIAFSYCLHVIIHYKYVSSIEDLLKEETKPVCLGCITTIGAFVGLLFTSSELLRDFGLFASLALVGTTFFALAFLPHFFSEDDKRKNERAFGLVSRINNYKFENNRILVIGLITVIAVCLFTSRNVSFDSDLANIGYREPKVVQSENIYNEKINNSHFSQYVAVCANDLDSAIVMSKTMNSTLDSLQKEGVIFSYSGSDAILIPEDKQDENIRTWKEFWTDEKREKAHSLLKKFDEKYKLSDNAGMDVPETFRLMTLADYQPQSLFHSGAVPEGLMSNFVEQNESGWLVFGSALMDRDNRWKVDDKLMENKSMVILDPFYYAGDMVKIMHDDFNVVLTVSSLFVFLVLLLSFKSILLALIGFMPMFFSWYVVQGIMALTGIQFNLINIMISTFIFGVGVDYSIFVMTGLASQEKGEGQKLLDYHKIAIFFSAVILIIVTLSLLFAKHPALYSVGISTIIGMISTILITYTLQPLLFKLSMKSSWLRKKSLHLK